MGIVTGEQIRADNFRGMIFPYAAETAPDGFLLCDGAAVSRSTYAGLYALIGDTYGAGNGSTTFNVPNLKGRVPVGLDAAQTEFDAMGEAGGAKTHTLTVDQMPAHTHTTRRLTSTSGSQVNYVDDSSSQGNDTIETSSAGGGQAHNNLQPYLTINFIIKT